MMKANNYNNCRKETNILFPVLSWVALLIVFCIAIALRKFPGLKGAVADIEHGILFYYFKYLIIPILSGFLVAVFYIEITKSGIRTQKKYNVFAIIVLCLFLVFAIWYCFVPNYPGDDELLWAFVCPFLSGMIIKIVLGIIEQKDTNKKNVNQDLTGFVKP